MAYAHTNLNSVTLIGRLASDATYRAFPNGNGGSASFTLAVGEAKKEGDNWVDSVNFIECDYISSGAEKFSSYLKKGSKVAVLGKLHQDRWEKDGQKNSRIKVKCSTVELCSPVKGNGSPSSSSEGGFPEDLPFKNDGSIPF